MTFARVSTGFTTTVSVSQANTLDLNLSRALDGYGETTNTYAPTSCVRFSGGYDVRFLDRDTGLISTQYFRGGRFISGGTSAWGMEVDTTKVSTRQTTYISGAYLYQDGGEAGLSHAGMYVSTATGGTYWLDTKYSHYRLSATLTTSVHLYVMAANNVGSATGNMIHGGTTNSPTTGMIVSGYINKNTGYPVHIYAHGSLVATVESATTESFFEFSYLSPAWKICGWHNAEVFE